MLFFLSNFRFQFHLYRFCKFCTIARAAARTMLRCRIDDRLEAVGTFADHPRTAHDAIRLPLGKVRIVAARRAEFIPVPGHFKFLCSNEMRVHGCSSDDSCMSLPIAQNVPFNYGDLLRVFAYFKLEWETIVSLKGSVRFYRNYLLRLFLQNAKGQAEACPSDGSLSMHLILFEYNHSLGFHE